MVMVAPPASPPGKAPLLAYAMGNFLRAKSVAPWRNSAKSRSRKFSRKSCHSCARHSGADSWPSLRKTRKRRDDCPKIGADTGRARSEEHTSELQSRGHLVCRLLLEKKNK